MFVSTSFQLLIFIHRILLSSRRTSPLTLQPKMSSTMTLTKPHSRAVQAGRVDHSIYPPVEFFHTIDGVIRSHAAESEQKPFLCYPVKGASDFEEHTPAEVDRYVDLAARYYVDHGLEPAVS